MSRKQTPDNALFREWYNAQPEQQRTGIKEIIIDRCEISPDTFNNWLYGNSGIRTIYKRIINDMAGETVFIIKPDANNVIIPLVILIYASLFAAIFIINQATGTTGF